MDEEQAKTYARKPEEEDQAAYCPVCASKLQPRSCKLICPVCGYYTSCSDFY